MSVTTAVVGRQPIVDRDGDVVGYELLFRRLATSETAYDLGAAVTIDGDEMTQTVISGALGVGLERLTGGKTVFCNADRAVLVGDLPVMFPAAQTVVEVLETVEIDAAVLDGCRALRQAGYRLAADDFRWFHGAEALLDVVDIAKIDIQATPDDEVRDLVARCRASGVQVLAEKVESDAELTACRGLEFDLYQGYLLGRPSTIAGSALRPSHGAVLRLASAALQDGVEFADLEQILRSDPALAYRLLQLAAIGRLGEMKRPVESIRDALVLMGLDRMRAWIPALMLLPSERVIDTSLPTVLTRARAVELVTQRRRPEQAGHAFAAGMLSAFDLLLGIPRAELPAALDIPDTLRVDAFGSDSDISRLIDAVTRIERPREVPFGVDQVTLQELERTIAQAFGWSMAAIAAIDSVVAA